MPSPHQINPPSAPRQLTCPNCFKLMRIIFIEADNNCEQIKFVCDDCRIEEVLKKQRVT